MIDASTLAAWLADYAMTLQDNAGVLTELDRQIGDADHGSNMTRGAAAVTALDPAGFADGSSYLKKVGMTLVSTVGGAAGPLYGTFFLRMAAELGPDGEATTTQLGTALRAGLDGVVARGKASEGDKTLVDALTQALTAYDDAAAAGAGITQALQVAAEAAALGRDATVDMVARKGRASYLGERSKGVADPGAASMTMLFESAARTLS